MLTPERGGKIFNPALRRPGRWGAGGGRAAGKGDIVNQAGKKII